jgi:hypothetical protein
MTLIKTDQALAVHRQGDGGWEMVPDNGPGRSRPRRVRRNEWSLTFGQSGDSMFFGSTPCEYLVVDGHIMASLTEVPRQINHPGKQTMQQTHRYPTPPPPLATEEVIIMPPPAPVEPIPEPVVAAAPCGPGPVRCRCPGAGLAAGRRGTGTGGAGRQGGRGTAARLVRF